MKDLKQFIKTTIREFLSENKNKIKNVDIEFEDIKNSKFSSFRHYTLNDIVDNWLELRNDKNDNIQTIKYFVKNPEVLKYECLSYDKKGLADGYHRLIAMKIIGLRNFCYKYEDEYSGD
jgi:hypothetical protein